VKQRILAGIAVLSVAGGVGWKIASHPETPARLQDVSLIEHSEHSHPGPKGALSGIRIRLSPRDFSYEGRSTVHEVPQVPLTAE